MVELICVPPLTAKYSHNVGPAVTLAYAASIGIARESRVVVPWNCGGRKVDEQKASKDQIIEDIAQAKDSYLQLRLWRESFYDHTEYEPQFKDAVLRAIESDCVDFRKTYEYYCHNCNKGRVSPRVEQECLTCHGNCDEILSEDLFCIWNQDTIKAALNAASVTPGRERFPNIQGSEYFLKIFRESTAEHSWKYANRAFNQRFVAAQWPSYFHEIYSPSALTIVCGETVEQKWLLPALLMLTQEQREKTRVLVHGIADAQISLNDLVNSTPRYPNLRMYALAPVDIGKPFSFGTEWLRNIRRPLRDLNKAERFLDRCEIDETVDSRHDFLGHVLRDFCNEFALGKNKTAINILSEALNDISSAEEKNISGSDFAMMCEIVEYARRLFGSQ